MRLVVHSWPVSEALKTARLAQLDVEALTAGLSIQQSLTPHQNGWVPWDDYCVLLERIHTAYGGGEAARQLGAQHVAFDDIRRIAAAFITPTQLYHFILRVVDPIAFPTLEFRLSETKKSHVLELNVRIREPARACGALFEVSVGAVAAVPMHLGLPPAQVRLTHDEREGRFVINLPQSQTLPSRIRRGASQSLDLVLTFAESWIAQQLFTPSPTTNNESVRLNNFVQMHRLTNRHRDILLLVLGGKTNKEIARELSCTEANVEAHLTSIFRRCSVESRSQLVAKFWSGPAI